MGWTPGDHVTVRDIRDGVVYFAWPLRVIGDQAGGVLLAQRPGAVGRVLKGYPSNPEMVRSQMSSGQPDLVELAWARTTTLSWFQEGAVWVPRLFWEAESGGFLGYYVDFVRPVAFGEQTIDTSDLELDVLIGPDGRWRYKDEDSYAQLRQIGWVTDADHDRIEAAKPMVTEAIETRSFPFDGSLVDWRWPEGLEPAVLSDVSTP